ncbi:MAG TPA: N-formylglutamate amidohydrolase [Kiritimatiellia bacterium]|nr:N-formylglutamate amidohydrolase [Kiritimatiellia bacterium]HMP33565.1 N-formylglutamate amidohydrolase [Kiritimatiellia bacterium]
MTNPLQLVITCEHAGNRVPATYRALFSGAAQRLASHRGWDPGALPLARALARAFGVPCHAVPWTRLLVEANRSPHHPAFWSDLTRSLPAAERARIVSLYWKPHRLAVRASVARALRAGRAVLHVSVHSFTPELDGAVRNADIGLLYDPRLAFEVRTVRAWQAALAAVDPGLRVRRNYPYRGVADGHTTVLRRVFPDGYAGIELEVNQGLLYAEPARVRRAVVASVRAVMDAARKGERA